MINTLYTFLESLLQTPAETPWLTPDSFQKKSFAEKKGASTNYYYSPLPKPEKQRISLHEKDYTILENHITIPENFEKDSEYHYTLSLKLNE